MQQLNVVAEIPLQFKATWFNWITTSLPLLAKTAGMELLITTITVLMNSWNPFHAIHGFEYEHQKKYTKNSHYYTKENSTE